MRKIIAYQFTSSESTNLYYALHALLQIEYHTTLIDLDAMMTHFMRNDTAHEQDLKILLQTFRAFLANAHTYYDGSDDFNAYIDHTINLIQKVVSLLSHGLEQPNTFAPMDRNALQLNTTTKAGHEHTAPTSH